MIRFFFDDRHRTINLLIDEHPRQLMRKRQRRKAKHDIRTLAQYIVMPKRPTDGKRHGDRLRHEPLDDLRKLRTRHELAAFVEDE